MQVLDRGSLPQYGFDARDVVVTLGQDGLVANVAKYPDGQPLLAVNPDPKTIDGILLPIALPSFGQVLTRTLAKTAEIKAVTMAEVRLSDGQVLRAVNDLSFGAASHASARYRIKVGRKFEEQSSIGLIVSTGVGSTGWLRSLYAGALAIIRQLHPDLPELPEPMPMPWDAQQLAFNVREPWPSLTTRESGQRPAHPPSAPDPDLPHARRRRDLRRRHAGGPSAVQRGRDRARRHRFNAAAARDV